MSRKQLKKNETLKKMNLSEKDIVMSRQKRKKVIMKIRKILNNTMSGKPKKENLVFIKKGNKSSMKRKRKQ